jgi:hypothetical protein
MATLATAVPPEAGARAVAAVTGASAGTRRSQLSGLSAGGRWTSSRYLLSDVPRGSLCQPVLAAEVLHVAGERLVDAQAVHGAGVVGPEMPPPSTRSRAGRVERSMLYRCDARGAGGTRLVGLLRFWVSIGEAQPSSRPFRLVFRAGH